MLAVRVHRSHRRSFEANRTLARTAPPPIVKLANRPTATRALRNVVFSHELHATTWRPMPMPHAHATCTHSTCHIHIHTAHAHAHAHAGMASSLGPSPRRAELLLALPDRIAGTMAPSDLAARSSCPPANHCHPTTSSRPDASRRRPGGLQRVPVPFRAVRLERWGKKQHVASGVWRCLSVAGVA